MEEDGAVDRGADFISGASQQHCEDRSGPWGPVWIRPPPDISCLRVGPGASLLGSHQHRGV